jgi:hypothetical protein
MQQCFNTRRRLLFNNLRFTALRWRYLTRLHMSGSCYFNRTHTTTGVIETRLQRSVGPWPVSYSYAQSVVLLERGIIPSQGHCKHTGQHRQKETHTHASSGIRIHDPSIGINEDISCLRRRGQGDRPWTAYLSQFS